MFRKDAGGFTLIELLVVISIIGLLSSVILASLNGARNKAQLSKVLQVMNSLNQVAYQCISERSILINPGSGGGSNGTGGTQVCAAETPTLPDISGTGFIYCGINCGGWAPVPGYSVANEGYAISAYNGGKIIVCGSDVNVTGWYFSGSPFNLMGVNQCITYGF